jgi:hypothetical protein
MRALLGFPTPNSADHVPAARAVRRVDLLGLPYSPPDVEDLGDTYKEALADARSAILFHIETFGREALDPDSAVLVTGDLRLREAIASRYSAATPAEFAASLA